MLKKTRDEILRLLEGKYKDTKTALKYSSPFELLIAVILSAQCTDERVNIITQRLFPKYNTPAKMLKLTQDEMEDAIRDCGLFRAKEKNILGACRMIEDDFKGQVPDSIEALMKLPGVGRKTANVVASIIYDIPAIAVDTHVFRVSHRLGLASGQDQETTEEELEKIIPREKWGAAHHWLIWHGRNICKARNALCGECMLRDLCPEWREAGKKFKAPNR